jgi:hypothetical protein
LNELLAPNIEHLGALFLKRTVDKHQHAACVGMNIGMHRPDACDACPSSSQTLACHDEFALQDIDELRALVLVERESCTWLKSKDLHLQSARDRDIFYK